MFSGSAGVSPAMNNNQMSACKGWHSRGYIPHFDGGKIPQLITFRLADSLPVEVIGYWRVLVAKLTKKEADTELRDKIEKYLDYGNGAAWLRRSDVARIVEGALLNFDGCRYRLHSWIVMPNHVHFLITPIGEYGVPGIIHSLKSFTAKKANGLIGRKGEFWQPDYFDRYIRDNRHYRAAVEYIDLNPVRAGLCVNKEEWRFGSASKKE